MQNLKNKHFFTAYPLVNSFKWAIYPIETIKIRFERGLDITFENSSPIKSYISVISKKIGIFAQRNRSKNSLKIYDLHYRKHKKSIWVRYGFYLEKMAKSYRITTNECNIKNTFLNSTAVHKTVLQWAIHPI